MSGIDTEDKPTAPLAERLLRRVWPFRVWLWPIWLVALALWTAALLTSYPAEFSHENLSPDIGFSLAKSLHAGVYAALTVIGLFLPLPSGWRWLPVGVLSFHGFITEYLQQFVPLRHGCWQDVVIDHIGIIAGMIVARLMWQRVAAR